MSPAWFVSGALALTLAACGSQPPPPPDAAIVPEAAPAVAPAPKASGKRIGIGFAGNMIGEIEPCGCKANPTGGLARRITILDAWREGSPKADAAEGQADPAGVKAPEPLTDEEKARAIKLAANTPQSQIGDVKFDGFLVLDAGDTFADSPLLEGDRLERAKKTAALIVERFNDEGVKAQLVGDKDLALGRGVLTELARQAKYPFITTNLLDAKTRAPLFVPHTIVEVARVRVGIIGLVTLAATSAPQVANEGLALIAPPEAAKAAVAELEKQGVDVIVALSQLSPAEEEEVAKSVPRIQLFLGGDQLGFSQGPQQVGGAMSLSGGHKGRSVAIAALAFDDPQGLSAPFADPQQKRAVEKKLTEARHRVASYERLLAEAEQQQEAEGAKGQGVGDPPTQPLRRRSPIESYRTQLAAARADVLLAEQQLADVPADDAASKNTVALQLVNLGREVPDNKIVKARVDAFRKDVPATGAH